MRLKNLMRAGEQKHNSSEQGPKNDACISVYLFCLCARDSGTHITLQTGPGMHASLYDELFWRSDLVVDTLKRGSQLPCPPPPPYQKKNPYWVAGTLRLKGVTICLASTVNTHHSQRAQGIRSHQWVMVTPWIIIYISLKFFHTSTLKPPNSYKLWTTEALHFWPTIKSVYRAPRPSLPLWVGVWDQGWSQGALSIRTMHIDLSSVEWHVLKFLCFAIGVCIHIMVLLCVC